MIEGGDGGFLRIGDQAVDGLLAVDVGLVLEVAAKGVVCRRHQEANDRDGEEEYQEALTAGERGISAFLPAQAPAGAEASRQPAGKRCTAPENKEQGERCPCEYFGNVIEDVMAAFVAEDKEDFVVGYAAGGGIPHDDALGGAHAADISIKAVRLKAGLHQKHPLGRDVGSRAG